MLHKKVFIGKRSFGAAQKNGSHTSRQAVYASTIGAANVVFLFLTHFIHSLNYQAHLTFKSMERIKAVGKEKRSLSFLPHSISPALPYQVFTRSPQKVFHYRHKVCFFTLLSQRQHSPRKSIAPCNSTVRRWAIFHRRKKIHAGRKIKETGRAVNSPKEKRRISSLKIKRKNGREEPHRLTRVYLQEQHVFCFHCLHKTRIRN